MNTYHLLCILLYTNKTFTEIKSKKGEKQGFYWNKKLRKVKNILRNFFYERRCCGGRSDMLTWKILADIIGSSASKITIVKHFINVVKLERLKCRKSVRTLHQMQKPINYALKGGTNHRWRSQKMSRLLPVN